ncbi:hypothetical protein HK100_001380 [Physocladia obscura]|uniref:Uncharacterized protein n=1 Tax=Physocladia obscura TaxID=109957 RepID=A0AAD5TBI6_9FUNG|nr:hypothetical protein HK100_001380 [Physocladia obscura]
MLMSEDKNISENENQSQTWLKNIETKDEVFAARGIKPHLETVTATSIQKNCTLKPYNMKQELNSLVHITNNHRKEEIIAIPNAELLIHVSSATEDAEDVLDHRNNSVVIDSGKIVANYNSNFKLKDPIPPASFRSSIQSDAIPTKVKMSKNEIHQETEKFFGMQNSNTKADNDTIFVILKEENSENSNDLQMPQIALNSIHNNIAAIDIVQFSRETPCEQSKINKSEPQKSSIAATTAPVPRRRLTKSASAVITARTADATVQSRKGKKQFHKEVLSSPCSVMFFPPPSLFAVSRGCSACFARSGGTFSTHFGSSHGSGGSRPMSAQIEGYDGILKAKYQTVGFKNALPGMIFEPHESRSNTENQENLEEQGGQQQRQQDGSLSPPRLAQTQAQNLQRGLRSASAAKRCSIRLPSITITESQQQQQQQKQHQQSVAAIFVTLEGYRKILE